jgi:hypothetical protein
VQRQQAGVVAAGAVGQRRQRVGDLALARLAAAQAALAER